jgi:lipoyl(octanoyl) transferase
MSAASHALSAEGRALEAHLLGQVDFDVALALQQRLVYEAGGRCDDTITLLICEHPPIITIGRGGSRGQLRAAAEELTSRQIALRWVNRGSGAFVHGPGQVAVYPIVPLDRLGWSVGDYLRRLQTGLAAMLADVGLTAPASSNLSGIWGRTGQLVAIGAAVKNWVTYHGAFINVAPAMVLQRLVDADAEHHVPLSSLVIERQQAVKMTTVRAALVARLADALAAPRHHLYTGHPLLAETSRTPNARFRRAV